MEIFIHKNALQASQEELETAMKICGPSNRNAWLRPRITKILQKYAYVEKDVFMPKIISAIDDVDRLYLCARNWNLVINNNFEIALALMQNPQTKSDKTHQVNLMRATSDFTDNWCIYSRHAVITTHNKCPVTRLYEDEYLDIIKNPKNWLFIQIDIEN